MTSPLALATGPIYSLEKARFRSRPLREAAGQQTHETHHSSPTNNDTAPIECRNVRHIQYSTMSVTQTIRIDRCDFFEVVRMLSLGFPAGKQRQTQDVIATLALSLCKLRGVPPLSDRDLDALMRTPVVRVNTAMPTTREGRIDELIRQLDRLILQRTCR